MKRPMYMMAAVMVIGLGAWLLLSHDSNRVESKTRFLTCDTSAVDYVRIRNKDGDLTMKRVGATWKITSPIDFPANAGYVKTLIEKAAGLEFESLITTNKEKYANFELGDSAAYVEIGKDGGKIDKFYCGKPSETYTHTYMRREGSDEVWLVSGSPRSSFSRQPNDWRDKKVLELDKTMIQRILLKFPDETVELVRNISSPGQDTTLKGADTSWTVHPAKGEPFKPVDKEFNRIMNTVCKMNSIDFLDAGKDTMPDMSRPEFSIEVFLEGNQHEQLDFMPRKDGDGSRWLGRKNGNEKTIYVIYQSSVKNLMKRPDVLLKGEVDKNPQEPPDMKGRGPKGNLKTKMQMPPGMMQGGR